MLKINTAEAALQHSQDLYQKMIAEVQDYAILLLSNDGTILNWNLGANRIKGYTAEEAIGKNFRIFYPKEDIARGLPDMLLGEAIKNGRAFHEGWRVRKDKTMFWGSIVITALHDDKGNIIGFCKVTRDLTERKWAEDQLKKYAEQLEDKNKELEQFAYIASHDLKEPLRKIIAFSDILMNKFHEGVKIEDYIKRLQQASSRMMALINNLLAFSKITNEKIDFQLTDLNSIIEHVKEDIEQMIISKNVKLFIDPLPTCMVVPSQMHQLFQNLLINAIKFNDKKDPEIHITCEKIDVKNSIDSFDYKISVRDNGIGFGSFYKEKIFEIFHRIDGRVQSAGTGIGLAICKKIIENHNGSITAEAIEGEGAVFTILLPQNQPD
jgi:PAS domain S-box-containing protein